MTQTEYTKGQRVYSRHGHEAEYVGVLDGKHAVRPIVVYGEEEEYPGEITFWSEIFTSPPSEKLHEEIADLELKQAELRKSLLTLQKQNKDEEAMIESRKAVFRQYEQLAPLERWLQNETTHYVAFGEYKEKADIIEVMDSISPHSDGRKLRLVTISGLIKPNWNGKVIQWNLHTYSDGSGSGERFLPCFSREEALEKVGQFCEQKWEEFRACTAKDGSGHKPTGRIEQVRETAIKYGFPVPQDITDAIAASELWSANARVERVRKELEEAEAKLALVHQ